MQTIGSRSLAGRQAIVKLDSVRGSVRVVLAVGVPVLRRR